MRSAFIATILSLPFAFSPDCGGGESIAPLMGARAVSVGSSHACALLQDGTVACWGNNAFGEVGLPMTFAVSTPVLVSTLTDANAVVAGASHTCSLSSAGAVSCWGNNVWAEVGDGAKIGAPPGTASDQISVDTPKLVSGLPGPVSQLVAGGSGTAGGEQGAGYTCASLTTGNVWCWGQDAFALSPVPGRISIAPTALPGLAHVRSMSFGGIFGCAILDDGTVACWGAGPTTRAQPPTPVGSVPVPGLTGATAIAVGVFNACVLLSDATVSCWGPFSPQGSDTPTLVPSLKGVSAIAAGGFDTCALLSNGTVACWGLSYGSAKMPVPIGGVARAMSVSVGGSSACAVIDDGTLRCWGQNDNGQLGNGTMARDAHPVAAAVTVVAATAGSSPLDATATSLTDGGADVAGVDGRSDSD